MNRTSMPSAAFAVIVIAAAGCSGKGGGAYVPVKSKDVAPAQINVSDQKSLFPLAVGNQWVYSVETSNQVNGAPQRSTTEITFHVDSVTPVGNGTRAVVSVLRGGTLSDKQTWEVNDTGIYQLAMGTPPIPFEPIQPAISFPVENGRTFEWKGKGITSIGQPGTAELKSRYLGSQEVDTTMGSMSGIGIETRGLCKVMAKVKDAKGVVKDQELTGGVLSTSWWAPKVGLIRVRSQVVVANNPYTQTLALKSYSFK